MPVSPALIPTMPKAELHMHLEGAIEPALMLALGDRNGVALPYESEDAARRAYHFTNLQSFLDVYYAGLTVLRSERDFFDVAWAYLQRAHQDSVVHAEIFVSPQAHQRRGVPLAAVLDGVDAAFQSARQAWGMTGGLLLGIQRQWTEDDALACLEQALPWRERILGIGLGGPELPHPPRKFARAFSRARDIGWHAVAHAGEEGPAEYVAEALDVLEVDRIDHGVRCADDPRLVERLAREQVPLTVCPISNVKLRVFPDLASHNLKRLLDAGVCVTVNSDDPSYFLGYVNDNYAACEQALNLTAADLYALARNSFAAAFLDDDVRARYIARLDAAFDRPEKRNSE